MPRLSERNDTKFYIDSAVHLREPAQHSALIHVLREYGTIEYSIHAADVILVHAGETDCKMFDSVPHGTLVDYRYIEDDRARRQRGYPRLAFTNYIITKSVKPDISQEMYLAYRTLSTWEGLAGVGVHPAKIAQSEATRENDSSSDASKMSPERPRQLNAVKDDVRDNEVLETMTCWTKLLNLVQDNHPDWPPLLKAGFSPPPRLKASNGMAYTPEGRRWLERAETYWTANGGSNRSVRDRGRWFSYIVGGGVFAVAIAQCAHSPSSIQSDGQLSAHAFDRQSRVDAALKRRQIVHTQAWQPNYQRRGKMRRRIDRRSEPECHLQPRTHR